MVAQSADVQVLDAQAVRPVSDLVTPACRVPRWRETRATQGQWEQTAPMPEVLVQA